MVNLLGRRHEKMETEMIPSTLRNDLFQKGDKNGPIHKGDENGLIQKRDKNDQIQKGENSKI
jgi:hypothetical protein